MAIILPTPEYFSLQAASDVLGKSEIDLLHAASCGHIQLCVNIWGRSKGQTKTPMDPADYAPPDGEYVDLENPPEEYVKSYKDWWNRSSIPMPSGIYEMDNDTLRQLEISERSFFVWSY
jgi:hypothetical protein